MILENLKPKLTAIIQDKTATVDERLQNICKLLTQQVSYYDWVGFYFANHATKILHLKAYCGAPTEHTTIEFGKGICGQVALSNQNFVVPDVKAQDNYIACSISVKAEIVIPLFKDGINIGQIDIDSNTPNPFTSADEDFLTWLNEKVATIL